MCGICGFVGKGQSGQGVVQLMTGAMVHRGPDSVGYADRVDIHLGVRRLRIIDLHTGDQPIYNEDKSVTAILNGEIYNFVDLRRSLEQNGHQFSTQSDTEVIVHAYEQWNIDCVAQMRGMFAFAVLDGRNPRDVQLFLARDRLGIKPLYIWADDQKLLFASEVRALLATGLVPKKLSISGLSTCLAFGSVQEPLTMIRGVCSLPPASWIRVRMDSGALHFEDGQYWQPPHPVENLEIIEEVSNWLEDAVVSHLISDVPLGVFLSGGLDSGAMISIASQAMQSKRERLRAFTLGFEDSQLDERELAGETAKKLGIDLQVRVISPEQVLSELDCVLGSMDQPTIDGFNVWYIAREARQVGLKVVLSGVGGDELFAGYPSFSLVQQLEKFPRVISGVTGKLIKTFQWSGLLKKSDRYRKLSAYLAGDPFFPHPYFSVRGLLTSNYIQRLLLPQVVDELSHSEEMVAWNGIIDRNLRVASQFDTIGEISWLEMCHYMRSTLLRDTDMMGMAHSLEIRVPFVDHLLIEKILPIPSRYKVSRDQSKPLLVKALGGEIYNRSMNAPKKTFSLPFNRWLRSDLHDEVTNRLKDPISLQNWFDISQIYALWEQFGRNQTNWARPWMLYILDRWIAQNL